METDLEFLYKEVQSALKAKDYERASDLLRQILKADVDYKDAAQLLARAIRLSRRRWYNDPRLWGGLGALLLIGLGVNFFVKLQDRIRQPVSSSVVFPTDTPAPTNAPQVTATATLLPTPTPIPLTWKRVYIGQEFERDTVTALVIDPKDPEVLYAGMKNAGIFKSIDGGLSWRPAHNGLVNAHINSLLIDSENSEILYAGTMDGIYKTKNGGGTWLRTGEGTHVLMDPQDSSHLYARNDESIYESADHGKNWESVYFSKKGCPDQISSWTIHPIDGNALFIGGGETCEEGVYQSNDGGRTWTLVNTMDLSAGIGNSNLAVNPEWFSIGLDGQGNVILQPSEIVAFDTAGSNYYAWGSYLRKENITLGIPGVGIFTNITISPFDPNIIYVGGKGLAISRDGGLTWKELNYGLGTASLHLETGLDNIDTLYLLSGECEDIPVEGTRHGGYTQSLYISNNSGKSWEVAPETGCHLITDADGSTLYRTYQVGIWRSRDRGISWEKIRLPSQPLSGNARTIHTVVAHLNESGTIHAYFREFWYYNVEEAFFGYISEDYGHQWKRVDLEPTAKLCYGLTPQFIEAYRPMAIDPRDGNHVFVIDNGILLESHNSCDTTKAFATAPNANMNSIAFDPKNSGTLYAGTDEGAYISFDSGKTWNQINDGLLGATVIYSIVVDKDSNVYAATPYGIFKLEGK